MSFRDSIAREPPDRSDHPIGTALNSSEASLPIPAISHLDPGRSCPRAHSPVSSIRISHQECPTATVAPGDCPASDGWGWDHGEAAGSQRLPVGSSVAQQDARSDGAVAHSGAPRLRSSVPSASGRSVEGIRGRLNSRIAYPSAPITFTKSFGSKVQWGAYTRRAHGYLNAEAVHAAAAADERLSRSECLRQIGAIQRLDTASSGRAMEGGSSGAKREASRGREVQESNSAGVHMDPSSGTSRRTPGVGMASFRFAPMVATRQTAKSAASGIEDTSGSVDLAAGLPHVQSTRTPGPRAFLGSWIFKGSDASTELERILKVESDIAETADARSELAATRLLQEDMEAMITNLQQVKTFLVAKLRECETALLTTAQERDDLEATLQQIQSGIQDSVAEHRRHVEEYKTKVTAKERELEELRMQLEKVTKEAATLKKENEALKGEVNVARVEAADVAAAGGFRIEEYQTALQILMERNKAQHRELKRLRVQLIKTRENYASALARVDELESLEAFRKNLDEHEASASPRSDSTPRSHEKGPLASSGVLQAAQNRNGTPSDKPLSSTSKQSQVDPSDAGCRTGARSFGKESAPFCDGSDPRKTAESPQSCEEATTAHVEEAGTTTRKRLGRSVTGLLASGVSRVLQHLEQAMSTDREPSEAISDHDSQESVDTPEGDSRRLHEEATLYLQRANQENDLIIQLEDGRAELYEEEESESDGTEASTLGSVARSVWQAAHELFADRALPPARLSTLRTVAASNPSAWEVLRERHRAAKSMPLFSSIPPAAYPMIAHDKSQREGLSPTERVGRTSSLTAARSRRKGTGSAASPAFVGALNLRTSKGTGRGHRESAPRGALTVELHSELTACVSDARSDLAEAQAPSSDVDGATQGAVTATSAHPTAATNTNVEAAAVLNSPNAQARSRLLEPNQHGESCFDPDAAGTKTREATMGTSDVAAEPNVGTT